MSRRPLSLAAAEVQLEHRPDGSYLLRSPLPLGEPPASLAQRLRHWSESRPEHTFLAERDGDGAWRRLSYGDALASVESIAQTLLARGLTAARPVMLLSDNSIEHALLQLAAMHVGIPAVPVSPAYSLMSQDLARLRYLLELVDPGLVYVADGERFARALAAIDLGVEVWVETNPPGDRPAALLSAALDTQAGPEVEAAFQRVGPDTVAKVLFTSGSTGVPKGVLNTQRMMCSNQRAIDQLWPFLRHRPPVIVDWLPWNHTFGGNHNFHLVLYHGGTLYIDAGRPAPGLIEHTVANLRDVSPTLYFNVPRGFDMLIPYLARDVELRDHFFAELDLVFYAAAALPANLWQRLEALSLASRGDRVMLTSAWGTTETAPLATSAHFPIDRAGVIGLPAPGCEIKLVPDGGKLEMRVRGPNVTPGYWQRPDLTRAAFDEEGFFRTGDAGRFEDPAEPAKGLVFDGRTAENFKLTSGTWVQVGEVRLAAIAAAEPILQDAVVAGHDREQIGLLIFPSLEGCRSLCGDSGSGDDLSLADLVRREEVREGLRRRLAQHNAVNHATSRRIHRALLLVEPPSIDRGEITDKGYLNQRAVLEGRAQLVEKLFAEPPADDVLIL